MQQTQRGNKMLRKNKINRKAILVIPGKETVLAVP